MGKAVAAAPESEEAAPLAALLTELAAELAALVAAEAPLLMLLEALLTTPPLLVWEALLLPPDEVAPAGKTVVRVRVSVSSWSLGSSSKSVEVVV